MGRASTSPPPAASPRPWRRLFLPITVCLLVLLVVAIPRKAPGPQARVVLLGDSITAKWPAIEGSWLSGLQVANRGIPGDVTSLMLARFDRDVVALDPRVVVLLGGTNDLALAPVSSVEQNLAAMADRAASHGIRVVLATLPPGGVYNPEHPGREPGHERIEELNQRIRELAAKNHATLVDYHAALSDQRGYYLPALTADGVHPSAEGYARMEPLLRQAIASALSRGVRRPE